MKRLLCQVVLLVPAAFFASESDLCVGAPANSDPLVGRVCGKGAAPPEGYSPPMISNGDLNMLVEWTGGMSTNDWYHLKPMVYWQGRREPAREAKLFGFGRFNPVFEIDGKASGAPESWVQTLDVTNALVTCEGTFAGAVKMTSEIFCALTRNVVAIRRTIESADGKPHVVRLGLSYALPDNRRMIGEWRRHDAGAQYAGTTYGQHVTDFTVTVCTADAGADAYETPDPRTAVLSRELTLEPGVAVVRTWFIIFADTYEADKSPLANRVSSLVDLLVSFGWKLPYAEHRLAWSRYLEASSVRVPDAKIQRLYDVGQCHLRCNTTRWSFPVGIFPHHWQGKYFGFDEMYAHDGLVTANHIAEARRCPDWRKAVMPWALLRQSHYNTPGKWGARWTWMSIEDGEMETARVGFWLDHIFNMGTICRSAWTQYLYSDDLDYLKTTGFPIMLECARFFRNNRVLEGENGEAYLDRCTDLERLGPSRERAFMTTCGAIYTLRSAAEAAELLGTNLDEATDFRGTADRLVKGLPSRDGRYIAYAGCTEESVATLGGLYPFPVFGKKDDLQVNAARHFIQNARSAGNMYPMGSKVCPWYAGKMSVTMTLLEDRVEAVRWLREAASVTGLFGETWEINEPGLRIHPWFATASGNCVLALNQMLLCDAEGELRLAPSIPATWKDYSFRLPAQRGVMVDCAVTNGVLARLALWPVRAGAERTVRLVAHEDLFGDVAPIGPAVLNTARKDGKVHLSLRVGPGLCLLAGEKIVLDPDLVEGETPVDAITRVWNGISRLRMERPEARIVLASAAGRACDATVMTETCKFADGVRVFWEGPDVASVAKGPCGTTAVTPIGRRTWWDPEPDWWIKRMAEKRAQVARSGGAIDLVFLGDSITHNWEGAGVVGPNHSVQNELLKGYSILNLGYGGDTTANILWRVRNGELDGFRAKLVMLMIGTNNSGTGEEVAQGVKQVLAAIRERQPGAKILLLAIFPRGAAPDDPMRRRNDATNAILRTHADGDRVIWCDFNAKFTDAKGNLSRTMMSDLLHPGPDGYKIWRDAVLPYFEAACGRRP
ncbi:MAG TPA: GDSL-type esterase/lipase family protein [Verrucomicrobiae bacterium]|nr:GDSL-type esterase/lipase family protein [Verrucomicrobiae bacterium]